MKPDIFAAHFAAGTTSLATAIKITRTDAEVYAFTTHDIDAEIDGVTYLSSPGLIVMDIVIEAGAEVGNLELTTLHDGTIFTTADILGGRWRNAAFEIFRYNQNAVGINSPPTTDIDIGLVGTLGEATINQNTLTVELRDLRQYLQQAVGDASSKTCRARLGDARCRKDLAAFTYTGFLTHVTSNQVFRDSSRLEAVNWFDEGEFTFTSGDNAGLSAKVKSHAANGTFTLALPMYALVTTGDEYIAVAGCRKRVIEDCKIKFGNQLNFVGEPHRQGVNDLTQAATQDV